MSRLGLGIGGGSRRKHWGLGFAGGQGAVQQRLVAAATRFKVANSAIAITAGRQQSQSRIFGFLGGANLTELRFAYCNFGGQAEGTTNSAVTIEAALELDYLNTSVRLTFSGSNTISIPLGGVGISDPIYPSAFGLTVFPKNSKIWARTGALFASGSSFWPVFQPTTTLGESAHDGTTGYTSQVLSTGVMTTPSGGANIGGTFAPAMVIGRFATYTPSLITIGDSITANINDTTYPPSGPGYQGRMAYSTYMQEIIAAGNLALGGEGTNVYPTNFTARSVLMGYGTHALAAYGVNDMKSGALTAAQTLAANRVIWAALKAAGIKYVFASTITPYTSSTNAWGIPVSGNQTDLSPSGVMLNYNALLAAELGSNPNLDAVVDFGGTLRDGTITFAWAGASPANTSDGLHPLGTGHQLLAPVLRTKIQSFGTPLPATDMTWVRPGALYDWDFKNDRYYGANPKEEYFFCTRTTIGYGVKLDGSLQSFGTGPTTFAVKRIIPGIGLFVQGSITNLFTTPFTPATQTIAVSNATQYTVSVYGSGSIVLSGAATGTVTAGNPVTFTTSSTSLTATVSGTLTGMQCETGSYANTPVSGTSQWDATNLDSAVVGVISQPAGTFIVSVRSIKNPNGRCIGSPGGGTFCAYRKTLTSVAFNNGTTDLIATLGSGDFTGPVKIGIAFDGTGRSVVANNGTVATDALAVGTHNNIYIGNQGLSNNNIDDVIERVTIFNNVRLSDVALKAETA